MDTAFSGFLLATGQCFCSDARFVTLCCWFSSDFAHPTTVGSWPSSKGRFEIRRGYEGRHAIEDLMHAAVLYDKKEIRPVNEGRMLARWKLGRVLSKMERGHGPG